MARRAENEILYKTFQDFLNLCLIQNHSLLWPEKEFWTLENLYSVKERMIDSPILGKELSFEEKLEKQMTGASKEEWAIICDIFFIYFLPSTYISYEKRLANISWAAQHGGIQLPSEEDKIWEVQKNGFTRTSQRYHIKYAQFWLIIMFAIHVKEHDDPNSIINNSQKMQQALDLILDGIPNKTDRAYDMRHAILYMAFPDFYERMISTRDKERLIDA